MRSLIIVQISDSHIVEQGGKTLGVAPMEVNLMRLVEHINRLTPPPDVVLLTGDVTDSGTENQVQNAARILSGLRYPFFLIPGNHDTRETLWQQFGATACPSDSDQFMNYVVEGYDLRLIGLDSTTANAPGGELTQSQLHWLSQSLAKKPDQPTIVFLHHPPVKCGVLETDVDGFIGAEQFGGIVNAYPCIERIICGHIHLPTHSCWHGTVVSTAPSIGMRLNLDLTMTQDSAFYLDEPGYLLHHWTDNHTLITHTRYVGREDGPHSFQTTG